MDIVSKQLLDKSGNKFRSLMSKTETLPGQVSHRTFADLTPTNQALWDRGKKNGLHTVKHGGGSTIRVSD